MVKRYGNLWSKIVSYENIKSAYANARKGKSGRTEIQKIDADPEPYLKNIQQMLIDHTFHSSEYRIFTIHECNKERDVADLPFYPDRIIHWALIQVVEPIIMRNLISETYAALPGRGTHQALTLLKRYVQDPKARYVLKTDVKKFFPSIDKDILMDKLRRRIKDADVLWLFGRIIYEYPYSGLPIGNYTSQYLANFYLSDIDHYMKEQYHCRWYLRYMDDTVILGWSKPWLHRVERVMEQKLGEIGLTISHIWQISPVKDRGVDFVGYRTFPSYCLLRSSTKRRLKRAMYRLIMKIKRGNNLDAHDMGCLSAYRGIIQWCSGYRLGSRTVYAVDRLRNCHAQ